MAGTVYIIGAGPGDPDLITIKAAEYIGKADVIVYDRLVNKIILRFARKDAELVFAGKDPGCHIITQERINELLVQKAKEGKNVARIKGGDPFLFGRGGEEAGWLRENGIGYEVVPGVTSAIAVPAYAGIPVTHRDCCSSLHIFTGHEMPEKEDSKLDFEALAKLDGTLVFLMGIKNMQSITENLMRYGKDKNTSVAVIENGTTLKQRVVTGTLGNITAECRKNRIFPPAVMVIGDVAALGKKLNWFTKGKLAGKKVLVTRPETQASSLVKQIENLGGEALDVPAIVIEETNDYEPLDNALNRIEDYSWLAFTSVNGVSIFFKRLRERKIDIRSLHNIKICAVGSATASKINSYGLIVEYIPDEYTTGSLLAGLKKIINRGETLLLVRADIQEDELVNGLAEACIDFTNVPVYRTLTNWAAKGEIMKKLDGSDVDLMTFTSPSAVRSFAAMIEGAHLRRFFDTPAVCIGPVTAKAAEDAGFNIAGIARNHTVEGLVDILVQIAEG